MTVAELAEHMAARHKAGYTTSSHYGVTFNLREGGYCARFVRQCHEAALHLPEFSWPFAAPNAIEMEKKLKAAGHSVDSPRRGDVVAFNRNTGAHGHIGIILGNGFFAENTSSTTRGPGTVISRMADLLPRVTGYYRPVAAADVDTPSDWAKQAWEWAEENNLMDGTLPQGPVTREMLATVLHRYSQRA